MQRLARRSAHRTGSPPSSRRLTPAWQTTPSAYLYQRGVHEPWIAEISPMQYGLMSKAQKRTYDAKRQREWSASDAAKAAWRAEVLAALARGEVDLALASRDARDAIRLAHLETQRAEEAAILEQRHTANANVTFESLKVGDRVLDMMGDHYGHVVKKNRSSVRLQAEATEGYMDGRQWNAPIGRLRFKAYRDV